jgi:hypothetical protein
LYVAFQTGESDLLENAGESWQRLFKSGGALDLVLGVDPAAALNRTTPAAGDQRLLVCKVRGRTAATLYRAVCADKARRVAFSSPDRIVVLDWVEDVSNNVCLASRGGNYELAIPLTLLDLKPKDGLLIKADLGLLRGRNGKTNERVYWSNKQTGNLSDIPDEANLYPSLWGQWLFIDRQKAVKNNRRLH